VKHHWQNDFSGNVIDLHEFYPKGNAVTAQPDPKEMGQHWYMEYCEDHHHH